MTHIHYTDCNTTHVGDFVVDVPVGYHWLLVMAKTPTKFWVDGEIKVYPANSAVLYRPGQKVYYEACDGYFVNNWIRFETSDPYITESQIPFGTPFPLEDPDYCDKLFELLVIEHRFDRSYRASSLDFLLRTLLNKLLESCLHKNISPQYYDLMRLRTAIQKDPAREWSVPAMADILRISPGYLQNQYKKAFGISCMEDVIRCRIQLAKEYLSRSKLGIAEIAVRCGYQHAEHFSRQFKQLTGYTPREFQKLSRG